MCVKPASCEARQKVSGKQQSGMMFASTEAIDHDALYLQLWHLKLDLIVPVLLVAAGPAKACSKVSYSIVVAAPVYASSSRADTCPESARNYLQVFFSPPPQLLVRLARPELATLPKL